MSKKNQHKVKVEKEMIFDLNDFDFIGNHVLVKAIKAGSASGWAKPKQKDDKPEFGRILSIGDDVYADRNMEGKTKLKAGDIILFGRYVTEATDNNGETFYFLRYDDIKGFKAR